MKNNVLVIGGGHHNTLGVVRSLGREGYQIELILIDEKQRSFVSASKYVSVCHTLFDIKQLEVPMYTLTIDVFIIKPFFTFAHQYFPGLDC